jgi:hypothetical protein
MVLFAATSWHPAGADEADPVEEKGNAAVGSPAGYRETLQSSEIAAKRRINKMLDTQLIAPLEYSDIPLTEILAILQDDYDLPIVIDLAALDAVGISADSEISVNLRNITLRSALELMFKQVEELTYVIKNEVMLITTEEVAAETLTIKVYRVDDLLDPSRQFNGADAEEIYRQLITVITRIVDRDSWMENGTGEGDIQPLPPGMLIIMQTQRVHQRIVRLLADIRETRRQIDATKGPQATSVRPITRGFELVVELGENPEGAKEQIAEAVKGSVDWNNANSELAEQDVWLQVMPGRLLVRHLPTVVHQVERVAMDMKLIKRDHREQKGGGGAGGGGKIGGGGFGGGGGYGGGGFGGGGGQF